MEEKSITYDAQLEFIDEYQGEAEAAISLNPTYQWAKIVVTDDKPNLNNQRVPLDEFSNIINTGTHAPIKMTYSQISGSHKDAMGKVIGTIAQLQHEKTDEDQNRIVALAAFWKKERPNDIAMLKDMYLKGSPPRVSWEISFAEDAEEDGGIKALLGTALTGLAIVANPAYGDRTAFIAMASKDEESENVEELEQLKERITALEAELAEAKSKLETNDTELAELREYKNGIETAKAEAEKFENIKKRFSDAGIARDEAYFTDNKEKLLAMEDTTLDFVIQELVSFATEKNSESTTKVEVPPFSNTNKTKLSPKELGQALRENKKKL